MTRQLPMIALAILPTLTGCLIRDNNCGEDGWWSDGQDGHGGAADAGADAGMDTGTGTGTAAAEFWLDPDTAAPGDSLIAGLQADVDFDWSTVNEVVVYGDVLPCTIQARDTELLITLSVEADATLGPVDFLVELEDGSALWLEDVMTVVDPNAPADDGTAGTGTSSGSTGSGSTGSGSTGSGSTGSGSTGSGSTGSGSTGGNSSTDGGACG